MSLLKSLSLLLAIFSPFCGFSLQGLLVLISWKQKISLLFLPESAWSVSIVQYLVLCIWSEHYLPAINIACSSNDNFFKNRSQGVGGEEKEELSHIIGDLRVISSNCNPMGVV